MVGSRKTGPNPGDYTFPATQGAVSGVLGIGVVVLLVVIIAVDGWGVSGLRTQLGLLIFGVLTWALMLHPRIRVRDGRLVLVNPFDRISVPLHRVDRVEVRSVTKVYVGEKKYIGSAVGRKTRSMARPTTMGAPGGPFSLGARGVRADVDLAQPGGGTADLLEEWVNLAALDARRDGQRPGPEGNPGDSGPDDAVERTANLPLFAVLGVLVVALAVTLAL